MNADLIEAARRRAVAGCVCCAAGLLVLVVLAYEASPVEHLDHTVLNAISTPSGFVHDLAHAVEQLVDPIAWLLAGSLTFLLASHQGHHKQALFAVALIAGTAAIDLALKDVLEHARPQSIPAGEFEWYPVASAFPSGHAAGALAISLAFLVVVPGSWSWPTAIAGLAFTLSVSLGLLVLNYHFASDILGGWLVATGWCFALLAAGADRE